MDFATPPYPWAVFFCVLFLVSFVNYMIALQSSPKKISLTKTRKDVREWCKRLWKDSCTWWRETVKRKRQRKKNPVL
jgi:hypothetical protein